MELKFRYVGNCVAILRATENAFAISRTCTTFKLGLGPCDTDGHRQAITRPIGSTKVIACLQFQTDRGNLSVIRAFIDDNRFATFKLLKTGTQIVRHNKVFQIRVEQGTRCNKGLILVTKSQLVAVRTFFIKRLSTTNI